MAYPIPNPVASGTLVGTDQINQMVSLLNNAISDASQFNVITSNSNTAITWSASQVIQGGCLVHTGTFAGGISDAIDTAANIGAYLQTFIPGAASAPLNLNGFVFRFRLVNLNSAAQTLTLNGTSTGVTYTSAAPGLLTMAQNIWRDFVATVTVTGTNASPTFAVTVVSVGTNASAI